MSEDIKDCPFCGGKIIIENISDDVDYPLYQISGHSEDCYIYDEKMTEVWQSKEEFAKYWNRRA